MLGEIAISRKEKLSISCQRLKPLVFDIYLISTDLYEDPSNCEEDETAWRTAKDMYASCVNTGNNFGIHF